MIKLKERQEVLISQIDAVVTALNTNHIDTPSLIEQGRKEIHAAIVSKT
jgi:hypothetical protein